MRRLQHILFAVGLLAAWVTVFASGRIDNSHDATAAEAMVPHFIGWLLLLTLSTLVVLMPEWRSNGLSWQKVVFWLSPLTVVADVATHWWLFGILRRTFADLTGVERALITFTYFVVAPVLFANLVALLTQIGKRQVSASQSEVPKAPTGTS